MKLRTFHLAASLVLLLFWGAVPAPAQTRQQAELQRKLTQRVEQIYKLVVSAEWKKVEEYVSRDTRNIWVEQAKSTIDSFAIKEVKIAPDGKRADVTVMISYRMPQVSEPFTMPQRTEWVYEKRNWFVKIKRPPSILEMFQATSAPPDPARSPLVFDQNPIRLPRGEAGSEIVVAVPVRNTEAAIISFEKLETNCSCLKAEMDKMVLPPGGNGVLTVTYKASTSSAPEPPLAVQAILGPSQFSLKLPVVFGNE